MITLKQCDNEDVFVLTELNTQLIEDEKSDNPMTFQELQQRMIGFLASNYKAFLFKENDNIIGYALVNFDCKPLYLRQFLIKREYREKHYGKTAFDLLIKHLDVDDIDLEVLSHNEVGMHFWEKCGFKERIRYMRYKKS